MAAEQLRQDLARLRRRERKLGRERDWAAAEVADLEAQKVGLRDAVGNDHVRRVDLELTDACLAAARQRQDDAVKAIELVRREVGVVEAQLRSSVQTGGCTVTDPSERLAALEERRAAAQRELARLQAVKEPHVEALARGEKRAEVQLPRLNTRIREQEQQLSDIDQALTLVRAELAEAERQAAVAQDATRAADLSERHGELREADKRCDELALALAAALDGRAGIIKTIQKAMGVGLLRRLGLDPQLAGWATWRVGRGGQGVITRALKFAGLRQHVDFGWTGGAQANVPLAELRYPELEQVIAALKQEQPAEREAA